MPDDAPPRKPLWQRIRRLRRLAASVLGALLVGALGWALVTASASVGTFGWRKGKGLRWLCPSFGESLARLSYDLPFLVRGGAEMPEVCIVYLDENAARALGQRGCVWDRRLHAQLLRRLSADQPRGVFFDIVFSDESEVPADDGEFAAALKENGRAFLGAALETDEGIPLEDGTRISSERVIPPTPLLRAAAAGWGLIGIEPLDGDYGVRRISTGRENVPSATWRMAEKLGTSAGERDAPRWMNFYGPGGTFPSLGYERALDPNGTRPGYFHDRIVVVGGRSTLGGLAFGKDDFRNPYGLLGGAFSTGAEVHLTTLLNLLNGEWLTRLEARREMWFAVAFGVLLGGALPRFRPHAAALLAAFALVGVCLFAWWLFVWQRVWFAWCGPAFVQTPVALMWAVGARYFLEERRRRALRNAFGHYLSPHIADRIADSDFNLEPGGTVVEASVLFTDLEGFTPLSEELNNPELLTQVLVKYFTQTTAHILASEGTIINFVGDAVTAVWGAPLADRDHVRKAALAAWRLHEIARMDVDGRLLRTRVGLHTGRVLAGNVGSAERFDYAVVGDPVNFASRLEGLNKFLGTNVLISDAVREKLGEEFIARRLGEFRVVGKKDACVIHELLGPASDVVRGAWCDVFEKGVEAFCAGDLDAAERAMRETLALRDGSDGPADFYLAQIAALRAKGMPVDWKGVVEFERK